MNFILKHKIEIIILLSLIAAYFLLRLPSLTLQPIFADEAIYIRWAQVMKSEPTLRFLPQTDGKTPLFMWIMMPLFKVFKDPLFAGRFLSIISGIFTMMGVFFLTKKVFNQKAAFWATFLYVIVPYTVFFDRLALVDSMLASFTIWVIYFAIWTAQSMRLDKAMFLGYLIGGAVLTKTPGMVNFLLLPLSVLAFRKGNTNKNSILKLLLFWVVAFGIGFVMYNMLRLGPQFHLLSSRNQDYVFSPVELIGRPLDPFLPHFGDISDWFPKLLTWPALLATGFGIWYMAKTKNRLGWVVFLWGLIPLLISMAFLRTFTARYLLTSIAPMLVLAGYGLERFIELSRYTKIPLKIKIGLLVVLVSILPLIFDYQLLTSPPPASLPEAERKGYFEQWTAGYGFSEIAEFLKEERKKGKVVLGTEGFFGTLPDGIYIYLDKADINIVGSSATISAQLREAAQKDMTYFVGNKKGVGTTLQRVELIKEFPKARPLDGSAADATVLLRVLP